MGGVICGLVQRPAPPQRHQVRDATPAPQLSGHRDVRQRAVVYEQARQRNPRRWSRSTRCWLQPEVVWINPPPAEGEFQPDTLMMAA